MRQEGKVPLAVVFATYSAAGWRVGTTMLCLLLIASLASFPFLPPTGSAGGRSRRCRRKPQRGEQHAELIQCLGADGVGRRNSGSAGFNRDIIDG